MWMHRGRLFRARVILWIATSLRALLVLVLRLGR